MWGKQQGRPTTVAVIGLGRFGGAVAHALTELGHQVLGIDEDATLVQAWSDRLAHCVQADASDEEVLRELGVDQMEHAVVGIGSDTEASILAASALVDIGVRDVWAKALGPRHGRLLERVGAHHVVYPEVSMGERVAHQVAEKVLDYIDFHDGFAIAKVSAPQEFIGQTLDQAALRTHYGITVVGIKRGNLPFIHARPETMLEAGDLLIVAADAGSIQRFARRS